jgi:hypothetical protein
VPSDITIQSAREGAEGSKKRHKQRPLQAMTTADYDNGNNGKVGGSDMGHIMTTMHSDKC